MPRLIPGATIRPGGDVLDIERRGENPFDEPVSILKGSDPRAVSRAAGARFTAGGGGGGVVELAVLNGSFSVSWPDIEIEAQPDSLGSFTLKLLALLYLASGSGEEPSGEMLAFRQIPDGRFYEPVVARSVEAPLGEAFGSDLEAFSHAAVELGGVETEQADASYSFRIFPHVVLQFLLWTLDEEFPSRVQVLFDSSATTHLGAFELRMAAQEISSRLIKISAG